MKFTEFYVVSNISLPVHASFKEAFSVARRTFKKCGINPEDGDMFVYRRSVDARRRNDLRFVYSIGARSYFNINPEKLKNHSVSVVKLTKPSFVASSQKNDAPIVVVGSGPSGLFASLALAESGYKVTLIEKGGTISERKAAVDNFMQNRVLDTLTNIQFGAGGAGTFSDGKLVTRINDSLSACVLSKLVEYGAPEEIEYIARPHIGTDILCDVIDRIIGKLVELGVDVRFHTQLIDFVSNGGCVKSIITNNGAISCSAVILAVGHSARDTHMLLLKHGLSVEPKDFSVGLRIEHPRSVIDRGLYGDLAGDPSLPAGEYNLSFNTKARGVYTFCMCPGGVVVPATSEENAVVVNGMSYNARDGRNSNSAICCSIFKSDFGSTALGAIEFQRSIERRAFISGGKDYSAPIITLGDFLEDKCSALPSIVLPTYMNGDGVKLAPPDEYLPALVTNSIRDAIPHFDKRIPGFGMREAVLTGPETRTSSPVRVVRDPETRLAIGFCNLYPTGEGAGYAGGITSAAIDGIRSAIAVMENMNRI